MYIRSRLLSNCIIGSVLKILIRALEWIGDFSDHAGHER
jgi:hypothetical protein